MHKRGLLESSLLNAFKDQCSSCLLVFSLALLRRLFYCSVICFETVKRHFCSVGLVLNAREMSRVLTPTAAHGFKSCEGTCFTSLECSEMSKVHAVID